MLTPESREADFPSLTDRTYLNTAAEGIPPRAVIDALGQYAQDKLLGMDGRKLHEVQWAQARERTAQAYGLAPEDIGLCSCSSEAFNLAALALQLRDGDQVVINDLDFPAGATPWLQPTCPAEARVWRAREGALRVENRVSLLSPRTRIVTLSLVSFFNGFVIPLRPLLEAVRAHSPALVAVDVTQALGRIPLDLKGVDLVISSTHKWILGSHGGGLVGVPPDRSDDWTVPAGGWFNLEDPFGPDRFEAAASKPGAESFMVGSPNYAAVYAVNAALSYIQSIGVRAIADRADPLVRAALEGVKALPVELLTPDEPGAIAGILAFRHPEADRIHRELHGRDIHIMSSAGRLRVAIHGYNTEANIEHLLQSLKEALTHA